MKHQDIRKKERTKIIRTTVEIIVFVIVAFLVYQAFYMQKKYKPYVDAPVSSDDKGFIAISYFGVEKFKQKATIKFGNQFDYSKFEYVNAKTKGNIVCNKSVEEDLIYIFKTLFENKYQIDKIKLSDEYDFNDMKSMEDNNSSSFNFRKIIG